jgi:GTP-binding protein YchF
MNLSVGIVGLPNSGKSTLFNALLQRQIANVADYPFTTIEPNIGVVEVPDERLFKISQITGIKKIVPAAIKFVDIAGLIKGAHKGEGLGNQFLAHIRECDAILFLLRGFQDPNVSHPFGKIDPEEDLEVLVDELILKDLETVERKRAEIEREIKAEKDKGLKDLMLLLERTREGLCSGKLAKDILDKDSLSCISNLYLLTAKSQLLVLNIAESQISNQTTAIRLQQEIGAVVSSQSAVCFICAKLESELSELSQEERKEYLETSGISQTALDKVICESYKLLDLITFFTIAKGTQVQAWPVKAGTTAFEAAGLVHSDFQKGFITSEVLKYEDLISCSSWQKVHDLGKIQTCGKDYKIQDGDIIEFKAKV